jgi:hypothetical protein
MLGAVYVKVGPESYFKLVYDLDRLRQLSEFLVIGKFNDPSQVFGLKDFSFDNDDIKALKNCKPDDCQIQLPTSGIEAL